MGRGGGNSGGRGFSSGGGRGFSSHRSSGAHRGGGHSSFGGRSSSGRHSSFGGYDNDDDFPDIPSGLSDVNWLSLLLLLTRGSRRTGVFFRDLIIHTRPDRSRYDRNSTVQNKRSDTGSSGKSPVHAGGSSKIPGWYKWLCGFMSLIILAMLVFAGFTMFTARGYQPRQKITAGGTFLTDTILEDQLGWLFDSETVKREMEYFYQATGVQPFLLICDNLGGKGEDITDAEAERYLKELYDTLFEDEGHMMFIFLEYAESEYITTIYAGSTAGSVVDSAAREIILRNADRYYVDSSLSDEEFFAKVFHDSADQIMKDPSGNTAIAVVCLVLSVLAAISLAVGFIIFKIAQERRKSLEEANVLLNTPVSGLGISPEEQELLNKYTNNQGGKR